MTRPRKYTVDFFPHICKQGKTMYIIESRYGNDGYAFWFKLLELLASTEGHYFDANNDMQLEFLGAKTRLSGVKTTELLGLLSTLDAIDKDLWVNHKVIWCQKLVDNVTEVYDNRSGIHPEKPYYEDGILHQNIDNNHISVLLPTDNPLKPTDNPQSRVEESKVEETKLKESRVEDGGQHPAIEKIIIPNVFSVFEQEINLLTPIIVEKLKDDIKEYTEDWVIEAIKYSSGHGKKNIAYIEAVLKGWKQDGIKGGNKKKQPPKEYDQTGRYKRVN